MKVNGTGACELYRLLKSAQPGPDGREDIPWNFTKFLVGPDGNVLTRYEPGVAPARIGQDLPSRL